MLLIFIVCWSICKKQHWARNRAMLQDFVLCIIQQNCKWQWKNLELKKKQIRKVVLVEEVQLSMILYFIFFMSCLPLTFPCLQLYVTKCGQNVERKIIEAIRVACSMSDCAKLIAKSSCVNADWSVVKISTYGFLTLRHLVGFLLCESFQLFYFCSSLVNVSRSLDY